MKTREAYLEKLEAQFEEWRAKAEVLKAKADKARTQAKIDYEKELTEIRAKQEAVQEKMKDLKDVGTGAWEDLRKGVESAWNEFTKAVDDASGRLK